MSLLTDEIIAIAIAVASAGGCTASKGEPAGNDKPAAVSASDATDAEHQAAIDCSKIYSTGDAAGILNLPGKVSNYTRPGSCIIGSANDLGSIIIFAGRDIETEMTWNDVTMSRDRVNYVAVPGIGDGAVRLASDGSTIVSKKGKAYCSVQLGGLGQSGYETAFTKSRGEALAIKLGALCNKYFAEN